MKKIIELALSPAEAFDPVLFGDIIKNRLKVSSPENHFKILKRSIDARSKHVVVRVTVEVVPNHFAERTPALQDRFPDVSNKKKVIIVGAGPAGLFAALRLIELGLRPVLVERGKDVRSRRRDLAAINKEHVVNPDSNYCFGEGGAGTYSDGKLYTRSKKRGDISRILNLLCLHGAKEDILYDAHPHIGTNKLPGIVSAISKTIRDCGGEVYFENRVTDFIIRDNSMKGVITGSGEFHGESVVLAAGHSAREIFRLMDRRRIKIEPKPFALGLRVEHNQNFIDRAQYNCSGDRGLYLPAASYSLVHQATVNGKDRGVFSFCMCPGGFIVPSATSPGEVVVNGMSPSRRDSKFANSGIVVTVNEEDFIPFRKYETLAAIEFQASVEQRACFENRQDAPAQRLEDFVNRKVSATLNETSYQPGLRSADLHSILPKAVGEALVQGFKSFGNKIKGYLTNEAQVIGVESRTSSPVKIPRNKETLEHVQVEGLFPCGEGAGYAGGIMSAAMDGERVAEAIAMKIKR